MANHFFLLVLCLSLLSVSADVFVSIDCGASGFYTDENSIAWMGDSTIMQNGVSQVVQSNNSISHVMDTLRVFTTRKKNCYSVQADKGGQVLIRASFFYGNYDGKSSPPTFNLQFDGNDWASVETSSTEVSSYEVVYVVKGDVLSVCVAQTKAGQLPFISALEVRSLGSNMYSGVDSNYALFLRLRLAYGANATIRYVDDIYDRIWVPGVAGNGLIQVTSDAMFINVNVEDSPPQQVLQNAITTSNTSEYIVLGAGSPPVAVPAYLNMYFSEVTQLDQTQKRSFKVFKGNESFSDPIIPPYGNVSEMSASNFTVTANTTFFLVPTPDSTLPPLINAIELFYISGVLTNGTNSKDVEGLVALQNLFVVLQDWGGDPCLPAPYSWDWINCSTDATPRVTAMYLSGFGLSGALPDLSSMDALEILDLHNNSLDGPIPDFLGTLPKLQELNLADNQFSGSIPTSLSKNNNLKLIVTGNPSLCTSGTSCQTANTPDLAGSPVTRNSGGKKSSNLPVILGSTIPTFFVFWAIVGVLAILHHKRKTAAVAAMGPGQNGGANGPNGTTHGMGTNAKMAVKIGEALVHEFINMEENQGNVQLADQMNPQTQQSQ
ncbi:unnamed protein product [Ilex paraguariensis]|uniref:Malectin-like domain-containing protein n=1 Tax=Ilex paraguariensis TaxID=185542 RepID=A0ABC8UR39_9AQUA